MTRITPLGTSEAAGSPRFQIVYRDREGFNRLGNCMPGQLTDEGKASLFKLGLNLHHAYVFRTPLLKPVPDHGEVHVRSTEVPRAIESAQNLLEGLFPAWANGKTGRETPIEININEYKEEYIYPNYTHCSKLKREFDKVASEIKKTRKEELQKYTSHFRQLDPAVLSKHSTNDIFDSFVCAEAHGIPLPEKLDLEMAQKTQNLLIEQWWGAFQRVESVRRLGIGRVVGEIADNLREKAVGKSKVKFHLMSGHDSTIAPLLIAFDHFDQRWPPFAANVIFELYEGKNQQAASSPSVDAHYVRMLYNNTVLRLPGCKTTAVEDGTLCPLKNFLEIAATATPKDFHLECQEGNA